MAQEPMVVVVWGDSIAASGWPALAETSYNVALNTGRAIRVVNEGVGGMTAARARHEFEQRIAPHRPAIVVIQFGFNDLRHDGTRGPLPLSTPEEFAGHLGEMVTRCQGLGAGVLLLGNHRTRRPTTLPTGLTYDQARQQYNEVARRVAAERRARYLAMSTAGLVEGAPWHDLVSEDGVHLSPIGLHAYAAAVSSELAAMVREMS